ncbi:MAG TPA: hypothetical protein VGZ93_11580 [Candidatus Methylacidiphilales bacterium]|jgi:hypothetical protein|nr:hypothetical protein [Candidatus Methylacidiphilales bacterium]
MKIHYLLPALLLVGCASSNPPITDGSPGPLPQKHDVPNTASVRTPEQLKAYPVGRYEDPDDPDVMHEGHTIYRAETSPEWNTDPNAPTDLPLGPGEMAEADPAQEHTALTAELEQRLKQEDQLLQTTYEQNERLAQEIGKLEEQQQHTLLPVPPPSSPVAAPEPKPQTDTPPQPPPVTTAPASQKSWWSWLWPQPQPSTTPKTK